MNKTILKSVVAVLFIVFMFLGAIYLIGYYYNHDVLDESELRLVVYLPGGTNFGSAVIYEEDDTHYYALTNDHVISDYTQIQAVDYDNKTYAVEVVDSSDYYDLAVIKIEKDERLKMLKFSNAFSVYDEVIAVGYPSSIYQESQGSITGYETIDYDIEFAVIIHSADIQKGSSGGALVNQDNELIGINFAGYFDNNELTEGYAIPIEQIRTYLEGVTIE